MPESEPQVDFNFLPKKGGDRQSFTSNNVIANVARARAKVTYLKNAPEDLKEAKDALLSWLDTKYGTDARYHRGDLGLPIDSIDLIRESDTSVIADIIYRHSSVSYPLIPANQNIRTSPSSRTIRWDFNGNIWTSYQTGAAAGCRAPSAEDNVVFLFQTQGGSPEQFPFRINPTTWVQPLTEIYVDTVLDADPFTVPEVVAAIGLVGNPILHPDSKLTGNRFLFRGPAFRPVKTETGIRWVGYYHFTYNHACWVKSKPLYIGLFDEGSVISEIIPEFESGNMVLGNDLPVHTPPI